MFNTSLRRTVGIAALGVIALVAAGSAQATRTGSDGMDQLLAEVRGLRAELRQAAGASTRMQLLLARLSLQEQRITALNRQASDLQQQLAELAQARTTTAEHLDRLTTAFQNTGVPTQDQKAIEYEIAALKTRVVEQQQEEQRLQLQFTQISNVIATEQGRWMEFNTRLDELERSLR
jgi:chromosome segregation ATPase